MAKNPGEKGANPARSNRSEPRIRVPKTAELIAARIRRQIIRGEIREGEALSPETKLTLEFGVSRPTLREAFRILESESLISVTRGSRGGARVHPPDVRVAARYLGLLLQYGGATLEDVYDARLIVEPPAAGMLAKRRDLGAVDTLRNLIEQEGEVLEDAQAFAELSTRFHELVVELTGNQTLALLVGMLHDILEMHAATSLTSNMNLAATKRAVRSHEKLADLVEAGDAEAAEKHWQNHVRIAGQTVLSVAGRKSVIDLFD